jgi:simple sugar transport system ATP-binding protein
MTVGERQQLEIIRLLALGVQIIILDEPTTGISAPQKLQLFATLRRLAHDEQKTVIFVSHKLEEVEDLCDDVTVLRLGKVTGQAEMPVSIDALVKLMFGQSIAMPTKPPIPLGSPRLCAEKITLHSQRLQVTDACLTAHAGEVIGFAGMEGSGQALFLRALAGLLPSNQAASGWMAWNWQATRIAPSCSGNQPPAPDRIDVGWSTASR